MRFHTHDDVMAQIMSNRELAAAVRRGGIIPSYALVHLTRGSQHNGFTESDLRREFASWIDYRGRGREPFGSWQLAWNAMHHETSGQMRLTPRVCQRCHGQPYCAKDAVRGGICRDCRGSRKASPVTLRFETVELPKGPDVQPSQQTG